MDFDGDHKQWGDANRAAHRVRVGCRRRMLSNIGEDLKLSAAQSKLLLENMRKTSHSFSTFNLTSKLENEAQTSIFHLRIWIWQPYNSLKCEVHDKIEKKKNMTCQWNYIHRKRSNFTWKSEMIMRLLSFVILNIPSSFSFFLPYDSYITPNWTQNFLS